MNDVGDFVDRIKKAVKSGGLIIITTLNGQPLKNEEENPFRFNEMNYEQFELFISSKFRTYKIMGIGDASKNWLRSILQKLPFYKRLGLLLKRSSGVKNGCKSYGFDSLSGCGRESCPRVG